MELVPGLLMYAGLSGIDMVSGNQHGWALDLAYGSHGGCHGHGNHCYRSGGCSWLSESSRVVDL